MTEVTSTQLAAVRDVLVKGLIRSLVQNVMLPDWMQTPSLGRDMRPLAEYLADDLLARGVVRDVATLADDETLVERITSALCDKWPGGSGLTEYTRLALAALAAAPIHDLRRLHEGPAAEDPARSGCNRRAMPPLLACSHHRRERTWLTTPVTPATLIGLCVPSPVAPCTRTARHVDSGRTHAPTTPCVIPPGKTNGTPAPTTEGNER